VDRYTNGSGVKEPEYHASSLAGVQVELDLYLHWAVISESMLDPPGRESATRICSYPVSSSRENDTDAEGITDPDPPIVIGDPDDLVPSGATT